MSDDRPVTFAPVVYELARDMREVARERGLQGRVVLRRVNGNATAIAIVLDATELVTARVLGLAARVKCLELVFDAPPWKRTDDGASIPPRLLGIEHDGRRVRTGEWREREGVWVLRLPL